MKKIICIYIVCSFTQLNAQSWQWGKRGGGILQIPLDQEETKSIVTDNNNNIYGISQVQVNNITIDGQSKTSLDYAGASSTDYLLFSFGCDGTYRWSKLLTGYGSEYMSNIQVDAQNNIYLTGTISGGGGGSTYGIPRKK